MSREVHSQAPLYGGTAGVVSGTVLIELARNLPEASSFKAALLLLAPALSVLGAVVSTFLIRQANAGFTNWRIKSAFDQAIKAQEAIANDTEADPTGRGEARKNLGRIRSQYARYRLQVLQDALEVGRAHEAEANTAIVLPETTPAGQSENTKDEGRAN